MRPEFSCNLADALPLPPWENELDWSLHITQKWEKRIPFSSYVQPTASATTNSLQREAASFPQFSTLAAELQLRILGVCPASTLFQLMHVSSTLRPEASKLFWANPSAYFLIDAHWLLEGGYPGYQCCDSAFLQNVQNVEIEYEPSMNNDIWPKFDGRMEVRQDRIAAFWDSVKRRLPQVKRIVINQNGEPGVWRGSDAVPLPLQVLMQARPCTVQISALVLEKHFHPGPGTNTETQARPSWRRSIYQLTASHTWEKVESRHSKTILLPVKRFDGLVGRFEALKQRCLRIELQQYSLWPLAIEALDRHHFNNRNNKPFVCPQPECKAYFNKAGEWTVHAAEVHYQHLSQFNFLPDEIRTLWEERARSLEDSLIQAGTQFRKIKEEWNNARLDEQSAIEYVWTKQLQDNNPWDAENGANKGKLWRDFLEWASLVYDN
jgi:hypothetical protein